FSGSKNRNCVDPADSPWNPQIRHAGFGEGRAKLRQIDVDTTQEHERLALYRIGHTHDGDDALALFHDVQSGQDLLFDGFVRHHFAADLRETREPSSNDQKPVFMKPADDANKEPP